MSSYNCLKCGKIWHGWAQPDICPDCGGELKNVDEKGEEKKTKENAGKHF